MAVVFGMTPNEFQKFFPVLNLWIENTLATHFQAAKPVASFGFARLPQYFSPELLEFAKIVIVDRIPMPPLSEMGLTQFAAFETANFDGITYLDTFFVKRGVETSESLYFHELVHVIQWKMLGPERFLAAYVDGLEKFGYRDSPLEKMAYDAEKKFVESHNVFNAERLVADQLKTEIPTKGER